VRPETVRPDTSTASRRPSIGVGTEAADDAAIGLAAGLASERFVRALLYEVKGTDAGMIAAPILILFAAAVLAALPPAIRAVRIHPAETLRI